jgi:hypothetical protein
MNGKATLAWSSVGTTKCTVSAPDGTQIGESITDGKATTPALATTATFTVACTAKDRAFATTTASTTVKVKVP